MAAARTAVASVNAAAVGLAKVSAGRAPDLSTVEASIRGTLSPTDEAIGLSVSWVEKRTYPSEIFLRRRDLENHDQIGMFDRAKLEHLQLKAADAGVVDRNCRWSEVAN